MAHFASWKNPRAKVRGPAMGVAVTAIVLFAFASIFNSTARAQDGPFYDFPFLVNCEVNGVIRAFYLSRIGPDGVAVYITPDNQAGTITIRGKAEPVGGDWSGSCAGKTLEQLRSTGQAYDLQH